MMINTVLGRISKEELGHTRLHEHILWAWTKDIKNKYDKNKITKDKMNTKIVQIY